MFIWMGYLVTDPISKVRDGWYGILENDAVVQALKDLGYDSFAVREINERAFYRYYAERDNVDIANRDEAMAFYNEQMAVWDRYGDSVDRIKPKVQAIDDGYRVFYQKDSVSENDEATFRARAALNIAVLYPNRIRSVNAAFNPAMAQSADLLAQLQTRSEAFQQWFGDSKVVDANGDPLVVYHKTSSDFAEFDSEKIGENDYGYAGRGFYFTPFPLQGLTYGDRTMPVYLSIQNPYTRTDDNWQDALDPYQWIPANIERLGSREAAAQAWTDMMKEQGFDGFIDKSGDGRGEIVAFEPTQIKSVFNRGTFDAAVANILEQSSAVQSVNSLGNPEYADNVLESFKEYYGDEDGQWQFDNYRATVDNLIANGGSVYRVVFAESPEQVNLQSPGTHWTIDSDTAGFIAGKFSIDGAQGNAYLMKATVRPGSISNGSVDLQGNPSEQEVNVAPGSISEVTLYDGVSEQAEIRTEQIEVGNDVMTYNQFAGPQALTANAQALTQAMSMAQSGKTNEQIRRETGWFRGPDDRWRFEIADNELLVASRSIAVRNATNRQSIL